MPEEMIAVAQSANHAHEAAHGSALWAVLTGVALLLTVSLLLGALLARWQQSPLIGYLIAGMFLGGPGSLHLISESARHVVVEIAELGVALLLFSLGLEFSFSRLRQLGWRTLAAGVAQVLGTATLAGFVALALGTVFPLRAVEAIAIGMMVALSSTACVLRVLVDRGEIDSPAGRDALAILLVQDMAVVPFAIVLSVMQGDAGIGKITFELGRVLLLASALVAALFAILNWGVVWVLGTNTLQRNRELTILLAVVLALGTSWAAAAVGLSPALGAFLGGMFLGSSPFAAQIRADVAALRAVLLTLFFVSAGMTADPIWMVQHLVAVVGLTLVLFLGKALVLWAILSLLGRPQASALITGLYLAQVGEFAFVLGETATSAGILGTDTKQLFVSAVLLSLLLTPMVILYAPRLGAWWERRLPWQQRPNTSTGAGAGHTTCQAIVIGFGPAGQGIGRALAERTRRVVVVDQNRHAAFVARQLGLEFHLGDATHPEVLEHAGVHQARVIAITLPTPHTVIAILQQLRDLAPQAMLVARARYQLYAPEYELAGAHLVINEEVQVGQALADAVLNFLPPVELACPVPEPIPDHAPASNTE